MEGFFTSFNRNKTNFLSTSYVIDVLLRKQEPLSDLKKRVTNKNTPLPKKIKLIEIKSVRKFAGDLNLYMKKERF